VEKANYPVNKTVPATPGTVPPNIAATFLHYFAEQLGQEGRTGVKVRQYVGLEVAAVVSRHILWTQRRGCVHFVPKGKPNF
jgi:hypothetical protein